MRAMANDIVENQQHDLLMSQQEDSGHRAAPAFSLKYIRRKPRGLVGGRRRGTGYGGTGARECGVRGARCGYDYGYGYGYGYGSRSRCRSRCRCWCQFQE